MPMRWALAGLVTLTMIAPTSIAMAGEVRVLCSNGMKAAMVDLVPRFERATKHTVAIDYGVSADLKRQIENGAPFDLAILTPALIDELIAQGRIAPDTRVTLARSSMALAIRAGTPKPDIRTTDALTRVLRSSTSISYAREGASSVFFAQLVQRLNLAEALTSTTRLTATGAEAAASVARGEAQLAVLPVSEILPVAGVEVLGTFPEDVRGYLVMVAGTSAGAVQNAAARELITFLTAPAARPVLEKKGMEPGSPTPETRK